MAPAAPTLLPSPPPITDRIALGALTHTFPPELVDRVVQETGRAEQRRRLLPARVVVYFVLALALYAHAAYEEVMRCLVEGLGWAQQARRGRRTWPWWHVPGASAPARARIAAGSRPWPASLLTRAGHWVRGCCCWPTGCWWAASCGGRWPAPAQSWCGGSSAPARPPPSSQSTRCFRTAPGGAAWMRQ